MARRSPQTYAKMTRELAVKEKRERKRAKKAEAAAARAEAVGATSHGEGITGAPSEADPVHGTAA